VSAVKDGLAKAWAEHLHEAAGFPVFPGRHDGKTEPPFAVVVVKRLRPTITEDDVHEAELRMVVVTDVAETSAAEHRAHVKRFHQSLRETPRPSRDLVNGVKLYGFAIEDIEEATGTGDDGKKVRADVFMIRAGAGSA